MNPEPAGNQNPAAVHTASPAKRRHFPNRLGCLFTGFAILVLAALLLPFSNTNCGRGTQTRTLAQAKSIGLALKIYAGDHDGCYPGAKGTPSEMSKAPATANAAYACLFPTYTTSEKIFGNKLSAYQSARGADDVIDNPYIGTPIKTLEPGENVYAYVAGLTDSSPPSGPLVLEGTNDGDPLHYNSDRKKRGGVWEGKRAVVIYLDNHGAVETLTGPENARFIEVKQVGRPQNALDLSWIGGDVHLLNPAVAP